MSLYPLLLFLHVLGAVGMFAAWGIEAVALSLLRQADSVDQVRTSLALRRKAVPGGPIAMMTAVITGVWLMIANWGHRPWIAAAVAALVLIVFVGVGLERRAMPRLRAALASAAGPITRDVRLARATLETSLLIRVLMGVAILGLMTVKPGPPGALLMLGAAMAVGLAAAVRLGRSPSVAS